MTTFDMDSTDLDPERLHPPGDFAQTNTVYASRTDGGRDVYYEPFIKNGLVGYVCRTIEEGTQREVHVYFNPSGGWDEGTPDIFVYKGSECDPAQDQPQFYVSLEELE